MPGGPIEQIIAQIEGAGRRLQQHHRRRRRDRGAAAAQAATNATAARRACRRNSSPSWRRSSASTSRPARALPDDAGQLPDLRLRRELFPLDLRRRPGAREDAGVDLARPLVDAAGLSDLDPARHPQGGEATAARFDTWTIGAIIVAYAIPSFLFAVLLLVLFAGGSYWRIFPLRGLTSDNWAELSPARQGCSTTSGTSRCR